MSSFFRRILHSPPGPPRPYWCRKIMDQEVDKLISEIAPQKLRTLEISGQKWAKYDFHSYRYEEYPEFDICNQPLDDKFDLIIAEQVFEHVRYPGRAGRNILKMLSPGGYFLITTPFLLKYHGAPEDCTRWTAEGLKYFLEDCGFPIDNIHTAAWGNRACVKGNFERWRGYKRWLHSLHNEPEFPVVVWGLARSPD